MGLFSGSFIKKFQTFLNSNIFPLYPSAPPLEFSPRTGPYQDMGVWGRDQTIFLLIYSSTNCYSLKTDTTSLFANDRHGLFKRQVDL